MSMSGIAQIPAPSEQTSVSWPAIFAGGVTAAAISIILALFGTGLGLAATSPWQGSGISIGSFTVLAAIWLIIVQWVASLFGGYMAGRLRTKWTDVHTDEVFFRDTAHGFLAWALGTLIVAAVLAAASTSGVKGTTQIAQASAATAQNSYYVDELFRINATVPGIAPGNGPAISPAPQPSGASDENMRAEAATILAHSAMTGSVSPADNEYLAQLVSEHTGLALADAQARVQTVVGEENAEIVKAKQLADAGRKASSALSIYTFVSLLIGAFIASVAGAIGGRLRDTY